MALVITVDPEDVAGLAEALVALDPVVHTVFGSIAQGARRPDATPWAAHPHGVPATLAARSQAHTPVVFAAGWSDVGELSEVIASLDPPAAGLSGPPATVSAVAAATRRPVTERMDERLFRLDELVPPRPTDGRARLADDADAQWLAEWYTDFAAEAFGRIPPGFDATQMVSRGVRHSRCWVWSDAGGTPRSFAVAHPPVDGVSRIGPVYTAPSARGHGYGSAATAAASRDILDAGDIACLYTDLANPTSNRIYRALGYRPVLDRLTVRFD